MLLLLESSEYGTMANWGSGKLQKKMHIWPKTEHESKPEKVKKRAADEDISMHFTFTKFKLSRPKSL